MSTSAIGSAISASINGFRLLDHPYYRAWQNGELQNHDLKRYAEQYRHFERCLPEVLAAAAAQMGPGQARRLIEANLQDERANPRPHLELFDAFGAAVGVTGEADPSPATTELVQLYTEASGLGPVPFLAVLAGYESQAAEIAATKAEALSRHHGLDPAANEFWTIHATAEVRHSAWTEEALAALGAEPAAVHQWSHRSARSWWRFLDEQEDFRSQAA